MVWGVGCRVWGVGCRVWGVGCRVQGVGRRVWAALGLGSIDPPLDESAPLILGHLWRDNPLMA